MLFKKLVLVVAGIALLTACGGGSEPAKAKPTPTPRAYTTEQLAAALPGKDDVADANGVAFSCPKDKERCGESEEGEVVSIDLTLLPPGDDATEIEEAASKSIFGDSVSVNAWRHESSDLAKKRMSEILAGNEKFDGPYDFKQVGDIKTGATPGEKGEGVLENLAIGSWKGHFLARRGSMIIGGEAEPRLIANAEVAQGGITVDVFVNVQSVGRQADYADKLARKALADYLKRLG